MTQIKPNLRRHHVGIVHSTRPGRRADPPATHMNLEKGLEATGSSCGQTFVEWRWQLHAGNWIADSLL